MMVNMAVNRWYRRLPALVKHRGALRGAPCLLFWPPLDLDSQQLADLEGVADAEEPSQRSLLHLVQAMMAVRRDGLSRDDDNT